MKPGTTMKARGFSLIEVLVTIVIVSVGLLGIAGLMVQAQHVEFESYQRGQALLLVEDMAQRIINNRPNAASYVQAGAIPASQTLETAAACNAKASQALGDICEWQNLLRGSAVQSSGAAAATHLSGARGCITAVPGTTGVYVVEVVWQGRTSIGAPATTCANTLYANDATRRSVTVTITIPNLAS